MTFEYCDLAGCPGSHNDEPCRRCDPSPPCAICNPAFSHGAWLHRNGGKCEACSAEFAGTGVAEVIPVPGYIEWWDEPDTNSRWYRHVGCDSQLGPWVVPLDDCPPPSAADAECAQCCYVRPLRAREPVAEVIPVAE